MVNYFKNLDWRKLAKITCILMVIYFVFTFSICLFKYLTYSYNGLDLAIFNQVYYNTSLGRLFQFTIHPTSYLGDHFKPMILFFTPFYAIFKSPIFLLFIQSLFLALAALPLLLICKKHLTPWQSFLIIVLYLFNPVTLNISLFEFHMLPMAAFFIFWAFYFYDQNRFKPFLLFAFLSMLVREDVPFIIFMFGIVALLERKKLKWVLTPLIGATVYFFIALKIISHFSAFGYDKFLLYYQWLGQTPYEIVVNFFTKPLLVLQHVVTVANVELILGFFLVFLFLPLFRPKYILLALGQFVEIFLGFASGELILRTHYGISFLIAFCLATIFSLEALTKNSRFKNFNKEYYPVILATVIVAISYNFLVLGPLIPFTQKILKTDYNHVALEDKFANRIPSGASLITSYDFIPNLSSRQKLYSLNYVFLGQQQYGAGPYVVPNDTQYLLINFNDLLTFHLQYSESTASDDYYKGGANLRKLLEEKNLNLKLVDGDLALWQKNYQGPSPVLYQVYQKAPKTKKEQAQDLSGQIRFLGFSQEDNILSLFFQPLAKMDKNYFIKIGGKYFPLGYGFYPTSEWKTGEIIQINFYGLGDVKTANVDAISGMITLDGIGSISDVILKKTELGQLTL